MVIQDALRPYPDTVLFEVLNVFAYFAALGLKLPTSTNQWLLNVLIALLSPDGVVHVLPEFGDCLLQSRKNFYHFTLVLFADRER